MTTTGNRRTVRGDHVPMIALGCAIGAALGAAEPAWMAVLTGAMTIAGAGAAVARRRTGRPNAGHLVALASGATVGACGAVLMGLGSPVAAAVAAATIPALTSALIVDYETRPQAAAGNGPSRN